MSASEPFLTDQPETYRQLCAFAREQARHKCERCGVTHQAVGGWAKDGRFLDAQPIGWDPVKQAEYFPKEGIWGWCGPGRGQHLRIERIVLSVAFRDGNAENHAPANLQALCQRCQLSVAATRAAETRATRRRAQRASGDLLGERNSDG